MAAASRTLRNFWICTQFFVVLMLVLAVAPGHAQWKPEKPVEYVVGFAPGGGNDKTARVMQKIWRELKWIDNVAVVNKVGGGGAVSYNYINQHLGDAHYIAVAQMGLVTNQLLGRSPLGYTDLTPLAMVGNEPVGIAVRADSPIKDAKDFIARLKADPASLSISVGSTRGASNHFVVGALAKAAGIDPKKLKILTFGGGAESVTNLLGGHIDAMSQAINNAIPHYQAGTIRIIGLSTARRSPTLPNVPTFREEGFDVVIDGWTVVVGPRGLNPTQITYWEAMLEKTVNHDDWKKYLESFSWVWEFKKSEATRDYLKNEHDAARRMLVDLGMLN
jgi:putative tricarboxylic transport membrane protein